MADVQQPFVPVPQKPQKSWFGRNWWWVLILILVGGGVVCCGVCGGLFWWTTTKARNSEVFQMTFDAVSKDPMVLEKLGESIESPPIVGGVVGENDAFLVFTITGPKGAANVESQGRKVNNKWGLTQIKVVFSDETEHIVPLGEEQAGGLEEAPLFVPPGEQPRGSMPPDAGQ